MCGRGDQFHPQHALQDAGVGHRGRASAIRIQSGRRDTGDRTGIGGAALLLAARILHPATQYRPGVTEYIVVAAHSDGAMMGFGADKSPGRDQEDIVALARGGGRSSNGSPRPLRI